MDKGEVATEPEGIGDRVQFPFLGGSDEREYFGSSIPRVSSPTELASKKHYHTRPLPRSISDVPTASSNFKYHNSFTSSPKSSNSLASTAASTASQRSLRRPALDQQLLTTPYDYGYDLPCEFTFLGCYLRFHATQYDAWVTHSMSHFCKRPPPPKVVCTICDNSDDACFERNRDACSNWRERMSHISEHFKTREVTEHTRPDYFVIKYMKSNNLISKEDYEYAIQYVERPGIDGLLLLGSPMPGHHPTRDEKQERYDLVKERRKMNELSWKEKRGKSQSKENHGNSNWPQSVLSQGTRKTYSGEAIKITERSRPSYQATPSGDKSSKVNNVDFPSYDYQIGRDLAYGMRDARNEVQLSNIGPKYPDYEQPTKIEEDTEFKSRKAVNSDGVERCRIPEEQREMEVQLRATTQEQEAAEAKQNEANYWPHSCLSAIRELIFEGHELPQNIRRLEWTCRCGHRSYDDFQELKPGGVGEFAHDLMESGYVTHAETSNRARGKVLQLMMNANNAIIGAPRKLARFRASLLPLFSETSSDQGLALRCLPTQTCRWLHICLKKRPYATKLSPLHVCKDDDQKDFNDATFFRSLRKAYYKQKSWTDKLLFKLKKIDFVQFDLCPDDLVDHIIADKLPPSLDEYDFQPPPPLKKVPPIGPEHMMHLFTNCSSGPPPATSLYLRHIPKRRDQALCFNPQSLENQTGWGLYFVENLNSSLAVTAMFGVSLMLGIIFAVCWMVMKQDIQGAFGVAAYVTSVMTLAVMTWQMWAL